MPGGLCRRSVRRIRAIVFAIVAFFATLKADHRVVHRRISEGTTRIRMAIVTIDLLITRRDC